MSIVFSLSLGLLGCAALLVLVRLLLGPSTADRVVAVDTLLMVLVAALGVLTAATREPRYIVLIVIVSLLGFVATTAAARYLELADPDNRADSDNRADQVVGERADGERTAGNEGLAGHD